MTLSLHSHSRANRLQIIKWITTYQTTSSKLQCLAVYSADVDQSIRNYCRQQLESIGLPIIKDSIGIEGIGDVLSKVSIVNYSELSSSFKSFLIRCTRQAIQGLAMEMNCNPNQISQAELSQFLSQCCSNNDCFSYSCVHHMQKR